MNDLNKTILLKGQRDGYVYAHVDPVNPDLTMFLRELASQAYDPRTKLYCFSIWDIKPARKLAHAFGYEVILDSNAEGMQKAWLDHTMKLAYYKRFGDKMDLTVPGLEKEIEGKPIELYPFQKAGVLYGANAFKFIEGDDMGCGKTPQVICTYMIHRRERGGYLKGLILAPTTLVDSAWRKNFKKFTGIDVTVIEGPLAKRRKQYAQDHELMVVSYGTFIRDVKLILACHKAPFYALDEAQCLSNPKSRATKAAIYYRDEANPEFVIPITGTPLDNRPEDIWALLYLVNPIMAGSHKNFEKRYVEKKPVYKKGKDGKARPLTIEYGSGTKRPKRKFTVMRVSGYKNLDELRDKIEPFMIRRLKSEVLKDLPPITYEQYDIEMSKREREIYQDLKVKFLKALAMDDDDYIADGDDETISIFQWMIRAQQICNTMETYNGEDVKSSKLEVVREFIHDHAEQHKIILFSRFEAMTSILVREFAEFHPLHLHGGIAQKKRDPLKEAFQTDPKHRLFISTLKAGGVGLDLFAADIVCFYDQWWAPAAMDQARDRAHRIGQVNPVKAISFVTKDTIEQRTIEVLSKKRMMISQVIKDEDLIKRLPKKILRGLV